MKRVRIGLEDVASIESLATAFWRAAKGKHDRIEVRSFEARLDVELARLRAAILDLAVPIEGMRSFEIRDPKTRTIHAPAFRDRVLHHALMAKIGPELERGWIADTFACRRGKGTRAAVLRAQELTRRFPWYAKTDIRSFFGSLDHDVIKARLGRRIKGRSVLQLCGKIVDGHSTVPGRGVPIGALTSQFLANEYLAPLDRFLLEGLRVGAMVRYMDDVVWWGRSRERLRETVCAVESFVEQRLHLEVKKSWQIQRSQQGLTFCGFRVFPAALRLSRRRRRRYSRARRTWEQAYELRLIDGSALQRGYASSAAIAAGAQSTAWRQQELRRRPAPEA